MVQTLAKVGHPSKNACKRANLEVGASIKTPPNLKGTTLNLEASPSKGKALLNIVGRMH